MKQGVKHNKSSHSASKPKYATKNNSKESGASNSKHMKSLKNEKTDKLKIKTGEVSAAVSKKSSNPKAAESLIGKAAARIVDAASKVLAKTKESSKIRSQAMAKSVTKSVSKAAANTKGSAKSAKGVSKAAPKTAEKSGGGKNAAKASPSKNKGSAKKDVPSKLEPKSSEKNAKLKGSEKNDPKVSDKKQDKSGAKVLEKSKDKSSSKPVSAAETQKLAAAKALADKKDKKGKGKKTEETPIEDDFIPDDDLGGTDEIGEYEEELKAVETLDIEVEEDLEWTLETKSSGDEEIYLTDAEGNRYCRGKDCDQIASVDSYCRYHYLLYWKRIQVRKKILADGKLEKYIEELTARYPDKFLEMIRRDLRTQKDFLSAIQELEIDESELNSDNEEETQSFIDEVRGLGDSPGAGLDDDEY